MKKFLAIALALTTLGCLSTTVEAKTYTVKNIGKQGLANSCARGGGNFTDGENSYSCTYQNGNIRECSKRDGHCIMETPKRIVPDAGVLGTLDEEVHHDHHTAPTGGNGGGPLHDNSAVGPHADAMVQGGDGGGVIY